MGLTVALADGRLISTGGRVPKSSSGYDLTRLFVGSEGTLGVITEIQLRLHGIPEAVSSATCQFPTLRDAVETVIAILQMGIPVARMELLDEVQMAACISYSKLQGLEALPSLFFEFHGTAAGVAEQAARRRRSPRGSRAAVSAGLSRPASGRNSGRRGTTPTGPAWLCSRATRESRRTRSCQSPA